MIEEISDGARANHELARALAVRVVGWARAVGAAEPILEALHGAVERLQFALGEGHVCLPLAALEASPVAVSALRARLLASGVVGLAGGDASAPDRPLVLDGADRLYLRRHFERESRLARALLRIARPLPASADPATVRECLGRFFDTPNDDPVDWQRLAVALALERGLAVISGGPGTGKTTTVAALLGCLLTLAPDLRIALAAPTGKAAARLLEAIGQRGAKFPEALRARLPDEARTLHRLLGAGPQAGDYRHHAGNPLPLDVLVVDEASMLDLSLAARLVEALPAHARLILLGDQDQLAAVEAGAVFAAVSADPSLAPPTVERLAQCTAAPAWAIQPPPARAPTPLAGSVVWLTRSYRFARDSGIGKLATGIREGHADALLGWLAQHDDVNVRWLDDDAAQPGEAARQRMEAGYAAYVTAVREHAGDPQPVFAAFESFRVLCAIRGGGRGVEAINGWLERCLRAQLGGSAAGASREEADSRWFAGRALIVRRNDSLLRLFNGDIGICLPGEDGALQAVFRDGSGGWRRLAIARLPDHETAFAMTVHKSQGSEFRDVLVLLPAQPARVVSRELLYTAVTRATSSVTLVAAASVLDAACRTPGERRSGLIDRMRECAVQSLPVRTEQLEV